MRSIPSVGLAVAALVAVPAVHSAPPLHWLEKLQSKAIEGSRPPPSLLAQHGHVTWSAATSRRNPALEAGPSLKRPKLEAGAREAGPCGSQTSVWRPCSHPPLVPKLEVKQEVPTLVPKLEPDMAPQVEPVERPRRPMPEDFGLPRQAELDEWLAKPRRKKGGPGYEEDQRMRLLAHISHDWTYLKRNPGQVRRPLEGLSPRRVHKILYKREKRNAQEPEYLSTEETIEHLRRWGGSSMTGKAYEYINAFRAHREKYPEAQTPPPST